MSLVDVRRACMAMLARREHSRHEMQQKLLEKGFDFNEVDDVLNEFVIKKIQCDERFCEAFLVMRLRQGHGPVRVEKELSEKGVSSELINDYLAKYKCDFYDSIRNVWEKKYNEPPMDFKEKSKQMRFLQSRGFTLDQINSVFDFL